VLYENLFGHKKMQKDKWNYRNIEQCIDAKMKINQEKERKKEHVQGWWTDKIKMFKLAMELTKVWLLGSDEKWKKRLPWI